MPVIVVSPFNVINFPEGGGHFWVYMQYVEGLRQLGCDVYWLEYFRGSGDRSHDAATLYRFFERMERFSLSNKLILYTVPANGDPGHSPVEYICRTKSEAEDIFQRADLLLNFHYAMNPGLLARFRRSALVDIDPGLLQFWISRGQLSVPPHDLYFTTGEKVGAARAQGTDCGRRWLTIHPPVCLEQWPYTFDPRADAFTTVSNWDADDWIVDGAEMYENTKRVAFREFAGLPCLTTQPLELALFLRTEKDELERRELECRGWRVRHSYEVAGDPDTYQSYIQNSRGEFSCAKPSYVRSQNAWISDRTLCYIASGKPAVVQDTGPSAYLPNGEGIFRFHALADAARSIEAINQDYEKHCRAARGIAETFFDSRLIVNEILTQAMS